MALNRNGPLRAARATACDWWIDQGNDARETSLRLHLPSCTLTLNLPCSVDPGMLFRPLGVSGRLFQAAQSSQLFAPAGSILRQRSAARSSLLPHHLLPPLVPTGHRHYSPTPSPHNSRSQFKVLPFVVILAVGSGAYVLLVKSRASARADANQKS